MKTLIITRHGNTFGPGDTVTFVGGRTDLPLVESGRAQAGALGRYLKDNDLIPGMVYASALRRAQETAQLIIQALGQRHPIYTLDIFNEIDYGPDENKTREDIIARIGEDALQAWETQNIPPPGWDINPAQIIQNWQGFADHIDEGECALVVTSNGIARFAPHITVDYPAFRAAHEPKMATGALGIFEYESSRWSVKTWNTRP